jgi:hypothetical protein
VLLARDVGEWYPNLRNGTDSMRALVPPTMSGTLNLNCLVLGHDASHIFPIEIAESKTVDTLRKAIKDEKRPAFDHVPADT